MQILYNILNKYYNYPNGYSMDDINELIKKTRNDLIREYEESIVDKDVTVEDHLAIASDMKDWISKIKSYLEYMSDIITAVKDKQLHYLKIQ